MQPATIKANYKEWRRAIVAAIRIERRTIGRRSNKTGREVLALELQMRRQQLKKLEEVPRFTVFLKQRIRDTDGSRVSGYLTIDGELDQMMAPGEPQEKHLLTLEEISKALPTLEYSCCKLLDCRIIRETA